MNGLTKAIKSAGTATNLAAMLGIKPMSVSRWKNRYQGVVPADRVLSIYAATGVTPHELRPISTQTQQMVYQNRSLNYANCFISTE